MIIMPSLKEMNNKIKVNINEASGISNKCRKKLLKLVEKHFHVDLPDEDYLNIDIELLENGNIKMRDVEYTTEDIINKKEDLESRFTAFQEEVNQLLNKNETNFENMKKSSDRNNLIAVFFITFAIVVIGLYSLRELLLGNLLGVLWLIIIVGTYIIPSTGNSIRNRYIRAGKYLKSIIYKKKK